MRKLHVIWVVCSVAASAAFELSTRMFERVVGFLLTAVTAAPPMAFAGDFAGWDSPAHSFSDPHVERHEAGTSRRAAARGI